MKYLLPLSLSLLLVNTIVLAEDVPSDLGSKLKVTFGSEPDAIKSTPIANLFEARFKNEIIYTTGDAEYVVNGQLIKLKTKENLTNNAIKAFNKSIVDKIDNTKVIEYKATGDEKYILYAFIDVECPYCKKLHKQVKSLNEGGVTVRYLAYPRTGVDSEAAKTMATIWCAGDKNKALDEAMVETFDPSLEAIMKESSIDLQATVKNIKERNEVMQKLNKAVEKGKTSEEKVQIAREFMKEHKAEFDKLEKKTEKSDPAAKVSIEKTEATQTNGNCAAIIEEQYKLGQSLQVGGTPALITPNAERFEGYDTAANLIAKLEKLKK